jgi:hypothetical protein
MAVAAEGTTTSAPPRPAQPLPRPPAGVASQKNAAATPAPASTPQEEEPAEKSLSPAEFTLWVRQLVLFASGAAAAVAFACACWGDRPYLSAAFCAAVAALCTGAIGNILSRLFVVQAASNASNNKK